MKKNLLYLSLLLPALSAISCRGPSTTPDKSETTVLEGKTMGTYYAVTYIGPQTGSSFQEQIDSLLVVINDAVSTYIPYSTISLFNTSNRGIYVTGDSVSPEQEAVNRHFIANFEMSKQVYAKTNGAFDPTVMPLVNYWGFGYKGRDHVKSPDARIIDSLLHLVDFDTVRLVRQSAGLFLQKGKPKIQLDFGGIACGYAIDEISRFLEAQGIQDYLVDIGGEMKAKGKKQDGSLWRVGISRPTEDASLAEYDEVVELDNISVSTSGNYRNFYEEGGVKYSHTINPKTGLPARNDLLSATVFSKDCIVADAYATACMVAGTQAALKLIESEPEMQVYLIYSDAKVGTMKTLQTKGVAEMLVK